MGTKTADQPETAPTKRGIHRDREFETELGARLRRARIAAGVTQAALGASVGLSLAQINKYELGKDRIAVGTLRVMAAFLGVNPALFFSDDLVLPSVSRTEIIRAQRVGAGILALGNEKLIARVMGLVDSLSPVALAKNAEGAGSADGSTGTASGGHPLPSRAGA